MWMKILTQRPLYVDSNKAVASGAVSYFLDQKVVARVARLTYGVTCNRVYNSMDPEHTLRAYKLQTQPSGGVVVPDGFVAILKKVSHVACVTPPMRLTSHQGDTVREEEELAHSFSIEATETSSLSKISAEIICYRGAIKDPKWTDKEPGTCHGSGIQDQAGTSLTMRVRFLLHVVYSSGGHIACC